MNKKTCTDLMCGIDGLAKAITKESGEDVTQVDDYEQKLRLALLSKITLIQAHVIRMVHGLDSMNKCHSFREIKSIQKITMGRVEQIYSRGINKLYNALKGM